MRRKMLKIVAYIIFTIIAFGLVVFTGMYFGNKEFREWTDIYILAKDIEDSKLPAIDLNGNQNTYVYTYGDYLVTLEDNNLKTYNKSGKKIGETNITISNPIFKSKENYLLIADKGGSKLYLLYDNALQWEKDVEGDIYQIDVNQNGTVGVIITGTAYKSVIVVYEPRGEESFKNFLSTTNATDIAISEDGEYVGFIEINTNSASIASKVKVISCEKAKNTPSEAVVNTYTLDNGILLTKINYSKNKAICLSNNGVYGFENGESTKIVETGNNSFIDIDIDGNIASAEEGNNGKFVVNITNVHNNNVNMYETTDTIKKLYCSGNVIAIDTGSKVEFINNIGWLIKKMRIKQNIKDIIVGKSLVAIIYKDKVEIMSL